MYEKGEEYIYNLYVIPEALGNQLVVGYKFDMPRPEITRAPSRPLPVPQISPSGRPRHLSQMRTKAHSGEPRHLYPA